MSERLQESIQAAADAAQQALSTNQHLNEMMAVFWQNQMQEMEQGNMDFKYHQLPLARIKKIMKSDEDVKNMMISGEVPILFSKACEIFILELTLRSWIQTEENKRRTLQKMDVSSAVSKSDMYDFLIDIVPRDDALRAQVKDVPYNFFQNQYLSAEQQALLQYQQLPYKDQEREELFQNDDKDK